MKKTLLIAIVLTAAFSVGGCMVAYEEYGPPPPRHVVYGPPAPVIEVVEVAPLPPPGPYWRHHPPYHRHHPRW